MKHISDLFHRYQAKIKPPQKSVIKVFVAVCEEVTSHQLSLEQCSYTVGTKVIHLQIPSVLKSEVLQSKYKILAELKQRLGTNAPQDIR
jgi:hypothetical protein